MMKRIFRLTQKRDFANLFRGTKRITTPCFSVLARKNNLAHPRFAFVVSKSVDKHSTVRNRLRRRAREWVRKNSERLMERPARSEARSVGRPARSEARSVGRPVDIVFIFKREAAKASRKRFYEELNKAAALLQRF